jgi:CHAD domain-containing protein
VSRRLERDERGTESVRRIVRRETKKALDRLPRGRQPEDAAIHDARKRIKRARAALRLVREPLGDRRYRQENRRLRDAARPLGSVRNARMALTTFDRLAAGSRRSRALAAVREALVSRALRLRGRILTRGKALEPTRRSLESVRRHAAHWRLGHRSWKALGDGVERVYRAGFSQLAEGSRHFSDEDLHELRKQAMYLRQQLEILEPIAPATLRRLARTAHQLADCLGEDHDLAMLNAQLRRSRGDARRSLRPLLGLLGRERAKRRGRALALARRLYREEPKRLSKRLEARWRSWRRSDG